ncbi:NAD-dependent DNA ligase LigA [Mycoplasmopsis edwardii]|uniref:NAD-dependent DNA ligase LigA n=1 Tax=Mycoplasmopsis edwardii TaxID=53558 RepID=A0ACD4PHD8_9BACT|nr:NAD-dependent DNA ligase LigA [Mycoplasmopsis edwardii]WBP84028.1 NAD-dependent DNA ligase LigA [Mycoplasmopsis edwardii]
MNNIKEKIKELTNKINKWNHEYYVLSEPSVSDNVYDVELRKLEILEQQFPDLVLDDSPTKKVGGNIVKEFNEYTHKKPMLSLAKAYSQGDVNKFYNDCVAKVGKDVSFSLEPKIDGASISLHYQDGILVRAVTRGTGLIGNDVTNNIKEINDIPKVIDFESNLEVRGEIYLPKSEFKKINESRLKNGEKPFANPRNAASGSIQQLDNKNIKERNLSAIIYDVVDPLEHGIKKQTEAIKILNKLGFPINTYIQEAFDFEQIWNKIEKFDKDSYNFECDGFVIKVNSFEQQKNFGFTAKFPKYAIAFKFETEEASSIIKNIIPTVGRTGKISYIAEIEPVELAQTIVQRATLHNAEFIKDLNINIGDEITLIKSGEIIPKITGLKTKNSDDYYHKILNCPSCQSKLENLDNLVDQFCLNESCNEKRIRKLIHFASKKALNIETLAEKNIALFYQQGMLSDFASIYNLNKFKDQILELEGFKDARINKILISIEESRKTKFLNVLYAVGIKHVGLRVAEIISDYVNSFKELLNLNLDDLININTIGESILSEIKLYLANNKDELLKLDEIFEYEEKLNNNEVQVLNNLTFVITGKLEKPRSQYEELIKMYGGKLASSVSKNVNYLITNNNISNSSKMVNAVKLGVKVISEAEFNELVNELIKKA